MRAVVITKPGRPDVLEVRQVETPEPLGDQVRVRVRAAGVNRADLAQVAGHYPAPAGVPSNIPGMEFAGEIEAIGPLVRLWKKGQRVMGIIGGGAQAEYVVAHEGMLVEIPENLDFVQAAAIPEVFMTAHDALFTQARLRMGERVLLHAAGSGVGTAAMQLAHAAGATVYGTSRTPDKLERAKPLGLEAGFGAENFADEVKQITQGVGVQVIIDFIGAPYLEQNLDAIAPWGRIVYLSTIGGAQANINLSLVMQKRVQLFGCTLRTRTLEEKLAVTRLFATQVVPLLASARVIPIIEQVYPLREVVSAYSALSGNKNFGKYILSLE